jgi:hypothetical protein
MKLIKYLFFIAVAILLFNCSSVKITQVNFAWPLESVFEIDSTGMVVEQRYALSFNIMKFLIEENDSSQIYSDTKLRIIRDEKGFYYITADGFKNVYIFSPGNGELNLEEKVLISEKGISSPAFNQRSPFIELLYDDGESVFLTFTGLVEENE